MLDHVAVTQHGALGDAGRAARVLQIGDIGKADIDFVAGFPPHPGVRACLNEVLLADVKPVLAFLMCVSTKLVRAPFGQLNRVTDTRGDNMLDVRVADDVLEHVREILENDDALGA